VSKLGGHYRQCLARVDSPEHRYACSPSLRLRRKEGKTIRTTIAATLFTVAEEREKPVASLPEPKQISTLFHSLFFNH
jgi:hypothetical protein